MAFRRDRAGTPGPTPRASSNGGFLRRRSAACGTWTCETGGSFRTEISQDGTGFGPHITGCFLAVDELERIVFTDALVAGWRPAQTAFVTAVITMKDHPDGTEYSATAMHRNIADRDQHEQLGFHDGWATVTRQLAELVESRA